MKKTTLWILAIVLGIGVVRSQEKQNDATWEETVSFFNKYKNYMKIWQCYLQGSDALKAEIADVKYLKCLGDRKVYMRSDTLFVTYKDRAFISFEEIEGRTIIRIPLKRLKAVDVSDKNPNVLVFHVENYSGIYNLYDAEGTVLIMEEVPHYPLYVPDNEMLSRFLKAGVHLAYLAKQERGERDPEDKF
ncbi:MAG: hypothetical protein GDA51_07610 [Ekhidna sp.]|nr:hypothetical protein [Ekhidna sp.]MBC6409185.1 hypothetical protein [Ekhidna sp.]MBC6426323.1 hypothetical protein [Ekhidna sp.]